MPAYVIVDIEVRDAARYEQYKQLAPASIDLYGGRYVARGGKVDVLEGNWRPKRCVILEFPSAARARQWWESSEYAEGKRLRQETAKSNMIVVEGL